MYPLFDLKGKEMSEDLPKDIWLNAGKPSERPEMSSEAMVLATSGEILPFLAPEC